MIHVTFIPDPEAVQLQKLKASKVEILRRIVLAQPSCVIFSQKFFLRSTKQHTKNPLTAVVVLK